MTTILENPDMYASQDRAQALADRIVDYWRKRGGVVVARVVTDKGADPVQARRPFHWVRSDMINGVPRRRIAP